MWVVIRYFLSSLVLLLVFYCLYCFAPNARLGPRDVWPGTLLATLGWQVISVGYSYYVLMSDVTQLYGGLGGIIVLMVWFYLSAMILIVGGQVNAILYERTIKPVQPKR